jgi:hypothetical protein
MYLIHCSIPHSRPSPLPCTPALPDVLCLHIVLLSVTFARFCAPPPLTSCVQTACPIGGICAAFADKFLFPDVEVAKPLGDLDELAGTHEATMEGDDSAAQV